MEPTVMWEGKIHIYGTPRAKHDIIYIQWGLYGFLFLVIIYSSVANEQWGHSFPSSSIIHLHTKWRIFFCIVLQIPFYSTKFNIPIQWGLHGFLFLVIIYSSVANEQWGHSFPSSSIIHLHTKWRFFFT